MRLRLLSWLVPLSLAAVAPAHAGERVIERFPDPAGRAGIVPNGPPLVAVDGSVYGSTQSGTVYRLTPTGPSGFSGALLASGLGGTPVGDLTMDGADNLYGVTEYGGDLSCYPPAGCGVAFELSPPQGAQGRWTATVLHAFRRGGVDGAFPQSGLLLGAGGVLYGTTSQGGVGFAAPTQPRDSGTVYRLAPPAAPGGRWTETVLWSFTQADAADGQRPSAGLVADAAGVLYGTTTAGGPVAGVVFALAPPTTIGGGWTETILYGFQGSPDGQNPSGGRLLWGAGGALFGTTSAGGSGQPNGTGATGFGTVYRLDPAGGGWSETVLYAFPAPVGQAPVPQGYFPQGGVVQDAGGALYGATPFGGDGGFGVLYRLTPPAVAGAAWREDVLHAFTGVPDGQGPATSLAWLQSGLLAGTTPYGGTTVNCALGAGCGVLFTQSP